MVVQTPKHRDGRPRRTQPRSREWNTALYEMRNRMSRDLLEFEEDNAMGGCHGKSFGKSPETHDEETTDLLTVE
jgi:hypothetical protein